MKYILIFIISFSKYIMIFMISSSVGFISWYVGAWTIDFVSSNGSALVLSQMHNDGGRK